ncbi:MAG: phage recombination protein Bet [Paludibacteraceae bacterium]|nr:phage recombination protein Bet [Paludibacteraceae bacterium]
MEQNNQQQAVAPAVTQETTRVWKYEANGQEVKLTADIVRNYLTKGNSKVNDTEVLAFMSLCRYQQLNPFLGEAYLVKYDNLAQIITSKEAFMKRAENNQHFIGFRAGIIIKRGTEVVNQEGEFMMDGDVLLGGWAEVHRDDRKFPTTAMVSLKEYSKGQATWKSMPCTMIRKVALVHALREAFPASLGELYVSDEMPTETVPYEEVKNDQEVKQNANSMELPPEQPAPEAAPEPATAAKAAPAKTNEVPDIFNQQ